MKTFYSDSEQLVELVFRVLLDQIPIHLVDAGYFFGQTIENDFEPLSALIGAYKSCKISKMALCGSPMTELPHINTHVDGFERWRGRLLQQGAPSSEDILSVSHCFDRISVPCMDTEALGLVRMAEERGWYNVLLFSPPTHRLRSFYSTVNAIIFEASKLRVYSSPCRVPGWQELVAFSQSVPRAPRKLQISGEFSKIQTYFEQGNLVPASEILRYLDARDRNTL